jgi:hypothetical protein
VPTAEDNVLGLAVSAAANPSAICVAVAVGLGHCHMRATKSSPSRPSSSISCAIEMDDDNEIHSCLTNDGPSHFDMDEAFCTRMRMAIVAGLECPPIGVITTPRALAASLLAGRYGLLVQFLARARHCAAISGQRQFVCHTSPTAKNIYRGGTTLRYHRWMVRRRAKPPAPHPHSPGVEPRLL